MGVCMLNVGVDELFDKYDSSSYVSVDVVVLKPLPYYAKPGTANIDGFVTITSDSGADVPEIMGGDIDLASSAGKFSVNSTNQIRLIFDKGTFTSADEAKTAVSNYAIVFEIKDESVYVNGTYDVKVYDLGDGRKTYDSIIIGDAQLLAFMKSHIEIADLGKGGMNPFKLVIYPQIKG